MDRPSNRLESSSRARRESDGAATRGSDRESDGRSAASGEAYREAHRLVGPTNAGMLPNPMANPGSFRLISRNRAFDDYENPAMRGARRVERILDSLRVEIANGESTVRVRRIIEHPREIFRLEIESEGLGYLRTTLLDGDALEDLLATDDVRARVRISG